MISSITAYAVFARIFGQGLAFNTPRNLAFQNLGELPFYVVFAVVCSIVGYVYVSVFYGLRNQVFRRLPLPRVVKPAIGGLMVGVIALWFPQIMAGGYGWIQEAIEGRMALALLLVLCFAKIIATSCTISSAAAGGVLPLVTIGAMLDAYGTLCDRLFPHDRIPRRLCCGHGRLFAGVARVPLTAMLMVCEMSGSGLSCCRRCS